LPRKRDGRINWPALSDRVAGEWPAAPPSGRGNTRRGDGSQKRKRLELDAHSTGLAVLDPVDEAKADALPLTEAVDKFLRDIRTFRKEYTWKKYKCVLELFAAFFFGRSRGALYPNAAENIRQISSVLMIGSLIVALLGTVFIRRFVRTAYLVASISLLVVPGVSANF
jgi:hypothetical protein